MLVLHLDASSNARICKQSCNGGSEQILNTIIDLMSKGLRKIDNFCKSLVVILYHLTSTLYYLTLTCVLYYLILTSYYLYWTLNYKGCPKIMQTTARMGIKSHLSVMACTQSCSVFQDALIEHTLTSICQLYIKLPLFL